MRILVDIDGIVGDFVGSFLSHVKNRISDPQVQKMTPLDATKTWHCEKSFPDSDQAERIMNAICKTTSFWTDMPLLAPDAPAFIRNWQRDGHEVFFVSTPWFSAPSYSGKFRWVSKHFPSMTKNLMLTWHKAWLPGDVLIDDKPTTLHAWSENHPNGRTATIKYDYHDAEPPPKSTYIAPSYADANNAWRLIYDYVNEGA